MHHTLKYLPSERLQACADEYWGGLDNERFRPVFHGALPPIHTPKPRPALTWMEEAELWRKKRQEIEESEARHYTLEELGLGHLRNNQTQP